MERLEFNGKKLFKINLEKGQRYYNENEERRWSHSYNYSAYQIYYKKNNEFIQGSYFNWNGRKNSFVLENGEKIDINNKNFYIVLKNKTIDFFKN